MRNLSSLKKITIALVAYSIFSAAAEAQVSGEHGHRRSYCERVGTDMARSGACQLLQNDLLSGNGLWRIFSTFQESELLERTRRRNIELALASQTQANLIEFCYTDLNTPRPNQADRRRELRRTLALSRPAMREDRERIDFSVRHHMDTNAPRRLDSDIPSEVRQPLTDEEINDASAAYETAYREIAARRFPGQAIDANSLRTRRPPEFDSIMRNEIAEWRRQQQARADQLLLQERQAANPFFALLADAEPIIADGMRQDCVRQREIISRQVDSVREFRRTLALSEPLVRERELPWMPQESKFNPRLTMLFTRFSWNRLPGVPQEHAPLSANERREAEMVFDTAYQQVLEREFPGYQPQRSAMGFQHPRNFESIMRREMDAFRSRARARALELLETNQLIRHFDSDDTSDAAVAEAARRARRAAGIYLDQLRALEESVSTARENWSGSDALDLMILEDSVEDVVRDRPQLCTAADRLHSLWEQASAFKENRILALGGIAILGCHLITRSPVMCSSVIGTLGAVVQFHHVRNRYHFQLDALESAVSEDTSVMRLMGHLSEADRQVLMAFIMIPMPFELIGGKAIHLAERVPAVRNAIDRLHLEIQLRARGRGVDPGMSRSEVLQRLVRYRGQVEETRRQAHIAEQAASRASLRQETEAANRMLEFLPRF